MGLQLRNAIREQKAFEDFKEANLTHLPYALGAHFLGDTCLNVDQNVPLCYWVTLRPAWL